MLLILSLLLKSIQTKDFSLAFGSCFNAVNGHYKDLFKDILEDQPDVWLWLGDMAYVDKPVMPFVNEYASEEDRRNTFMTTYDDKYYSQLRKSTKVIGIWDDHDYGLNNAGIENPIKENNKQVFLDYLDEPMDSKRR